MSADLPEPVVPGPVLVIGCGLIGTSVALGLSDLGVRVHLRDARPAFADLPDRRALGQAFAGIAAPRAAATMRR